MKTIGLCMIAAPSDHEAMMLDRCLRSAKAHVDEIHVTVTGDNKNVENIVKKHGGQVHRFTWEDHFARARNYSFGACSTDYVLWLDCDDVLVGGQNLRGIVEHMEEHGIYGVTTEYMYAFDEYDNVLVKHRKYRLVRNDGSFEWGEYLGEIHEDLQPKGAYKVAQLVKSEEPLYFEVHHLTNDLRVSDNGKRNLRISKKQVKDFPDDPRAWWNLANSQMGTGDFAGAVPTYETFIKKSTSDDERYLAMCRLGVLRFDLGDKTGKQDLLQALELKPEYPDAYVKLGTLFYREEDWKRAKEFLVMGMSKEYPEQLVVATPRDYDENSMVLLANCYYNLGKPVEALNVTETIVQMFPKHEAHIKMRDLLKEEVSLLREVEEFLAKDMTDDEFKQELEKLPQRMRSHPGVCYERNKRFFKRESSGREIDIYCGPTAEEWGPWSIESGIGGSEEAVIQLGRRLSELGWSVRVFNSCGATSTEHDGVTYYPFWEYNPRDVVDVLWLWRTPRLADHKLGARRIVVDLHDVLPATEFTPSRLEKIHTIFVKSKFQRELYPEVPDDKFVIVPNGIDLTQFEGEEERVQHSMVYTSSPDRGLEHLLDMWPDIRKEVPDATLKVFYGWGVYDSAYKNDEKKMAWKEEMMKKMKQPGITYVGRKGHHEIAREMMRADIFAYPCHFEEIDCISMKKAIAANCKIVTTNYAALGEYKEAPSLKKDEWKEYGDALVAALQQEERRDMDASRWSWDNIAKQWNERLTV